MGKPKAHKWAEEVKVSTKTQDGDRIELVLPGNEKILGKARKQTNTGAYTYVAKNDIFGLAREGDKILYLFANRKNNIEIHKAINHSQETVWVHPKHR